MSDAKAAPQANLNEVKTTPYSWFVAILVALTYGVSFMSRNVWSTAIPVAHESLGITMAAAGGLMTAFYIGYVISNFITGFMVDKIGPRLTLALATLLTGVFTLLIPLAPNYAAIFLFRVAAGFTSGPLFAGVTKYQISWFSPATRATAMGLMMSGVSLGSVVATSVFAPVIQNKSWQHGFTYAGLTAVVIAVLFYLFAKEQGAAAVRSSKKLSAEEKKAQSAGLKSILFRRSFIIGTVVCFLSIGANMAYQTYIMMFFTRTRGLSLTVAGAILGGTYAIGLFSGTLSGVVADLLKRKKLVCIIGAISSVILTSLIMTVNSTAALTVILGARVLLGAFMGTPLNALQSEAAAGPFVGRAMGIYNGIAQSGSIIFPLIFGFLLDVSGMNFRLLFIGITLTMVLIAFLILFMDEKRPAKT
ncbi:MAG: MFS transporter [Spirochaetaceae bacterium]|jgi:MFS family permease|nr:MFS transporter [Spirochaetaceae bacterium]